MPCVSSNLRHKRLPAAHSSRSGREHTQLVHEVLGLMKKGRHHLTLCPLRQRLACALVVPMLVSTPHFLVPAMVAAVFNTGNSGVSAGIARAACYRRAPSRGTVLDAFQGHSS